ncbi:hypothetical protein N7452_005635 [Penicillium brevicompactum]|uniref:Uncharacterized protein n=1 Tax=Penicillium brevicompactum TaxID=5074 RepID=A0A9W9QJ58_PENBR|nr:hypothetical protein N7452_005635 [Penicillium brevicompactum]
MTLIPKGRGVLLPHAVDKLAFTSAGAIFCVHPISSDISDGWQIITFKRLAGAVNGLAWWIEKNIGQGKSFEVLAYIGANDIRFAIFLLACLKTGHVAFFPSPRNTKEAIWGLLDDTACSKLVFSAERIKEATDIGAQRAGMKMWEIPPLWELLRLEAPPFPFAKKFEDAEDEPAMIIHSSGTTGTPKQVPLTNGYVSVLNNIAKLSMPPGRTGIMPCSVGSGGPLLSMSPFYHMMGLYMFTESIFHATPFIQFPDRPMTVDLFCQVVKATRPANAMLPPSIIEDLSSSEAGLKSLQQLHTVIFSGAPLSSIAGARLASKTKLCSFLGSSEAGVIPALVQSEDQDWEYFEWNPAYGVQMLPVAIGLYEAIICRPGDGNRDLHGIFHVFPDRHNYNTHDVFSPHPIKPGLWRFEGRLDDVLVLSNGEKFNPILMERTVEGHELVSRAVVVGQGRFQAALLIEPRWDKLGETPESSIIDKIWPAVEKANRLAPGHGKIFRSKVGLASRAKRFKTSPKGSTSRRMVVADYAEEIDVLYARPDMEVVGTLPSNASLMDFSNYIRHVLSSLLNRANILDTVDLSLQGLDSLQSFRLSKILQGALRTHYPNSPFGCVTTQRLYSYHTVVQLSNFMYLLATSSDGSVDYDPNIDHSRSNKFSACVARFTASFPEALSRNMNGTTNEASKNGRVVLLTGSTGSLGTYLLSRLLDDPEIHQVICLNRSQDASLKQRKSFEEKGLDVTPFSWSKARFCQFNLGCGHLGLTGTLYDELKESVDTIFHCAWDVNFNRSLEDFEEVEIKGLSHLLTLGIACRHQTHFHFISSISTVGRWGAKNDEDIAVPEAIFEDAALVPLQGYAEAKFVAEQICAAASSRSSLHVTIYRVGQLGGPTTEKGVWNKKEWLPSLIATAKTTGQIPRTLGQVPIDWIPVDTLTKIVIEIANSRRKDQFQTDAALFNLVNPTLISWESLISTIQKRFQLEIVDDDTWLANLDAIEDLSESNIVNKPALKILDVYRRLFAKNTYPKFGIRTDKGQKASSSMRSLGPVNGHLMDLWLNQWGF